MIAHLLRCILLTGVLMGVTLPKMTAVLAGVGLSAGNTVLICTGDGLEQITLDAEGNPVESKPVRDVPCLLTHALDHAFAAEAAPRPAGFATIAVSLVRPALAAPDRFIHDAPSRAPPRA
ncbi:DUF2946 family protein [Albibacillus kandeliae]|uniref:DUF2946 family protein n=1 Tax=Albibacillus kandeliae TaxID=2174228 RepID=UPI000D697BCB|nr:hypothetical protein [Albibacillus kandeliae]